MRFPLIAPKDVILQMYNIAVDEPFSFLSVKLTSKNKDDICLFGLIKNSDFSEDIKSS